MQEGSFLEAKDLWIANFFLLLFWIKSSRLIYSISAFGNFSKENKRLTFGQMQQKIKFKIDHRSKAYKKIKKFL